MASSKQTLSWNEELRLTDDSIYEAEEISSLGCFRTHEYNPQEEIKCSMCGDVGLAHYLFKCLTCSQRYQHIYCSKFYPYRIEATVCNWCLPMEQLVNTADKVEDDTNMKVNNITFRNTEANIKAFSNCPINPQVHTHENRTMAFECLLRVAELHEQGHPWDNPGTLRPTREDDFIIGNTFSQKCHTQSTGNFFDVGHAAKKLIKQDPASLMIISSCWSKDEDLQGLDARREANTEYVSWPSTSSAFVWHNHSHACMSQDQIIGMSNQDVTSPQTLENTLDNPDVMSPQTIKSTLDENLGHDKIKRKESVHQDLGHLQTVRKLNGKLVADEAYALAQKPGNHRAKDHDDGCMNVAVFYDSAAGERGNIAAGDNDLGNTAGEDQHRVISIKQGSPTPTHTPHAWRSSSISSRGVGKRDHVMNSPTRAMKCRYKLLADVLC